MGHPLISVGEQAETEQKTDDTGRGEEKEKRWLNGGWKAHRGFEQTAMGGVEIKK